MSRETNTINPKGYGLPIVGLFKGNDLLAYNPVNHDFNSKEAGLYISSCTLDEDEEDGVSADLSIQSNNPTFMDNLYFINGSVLGLAFGYIDTDGIKFGPRWSLVLKDFKVNYGTIVNFSIKLVDALTLSKADKGDDKTTKALDEIKDQLDGVKEVEGSVKNSKGLRDLMIQIDKMRLNAIWRKDLMVFQYWESHHPIKSPVQSNPFIAPGRLHKFYDINEFRQFINTKEGRDFTDHELVMNYGIRTKGSNIAKLLTTMNLMSNPFIDLFGNSMGGFERGRKDFAESLKNKQIPETDDGWYGMLKEAGVWDIIVRKTKEQGHPFFGRMPSVAMMDQAFIDEVFQEYLDRMALQFVEKDVNLTVKENIKKLLNERPGGPYYVSDLGRDDGEIIRTRNFNQRSYMNLIYKGGAGDVLEMNFETDFYSSSGLTSSQAVSIDGDTGDITSSEDYYLESNGSIPRSDAEVAEFIDQAVDKLIKNEELGEDNNIGLDDFIGGEISRTILLRGSTSRPAGFGEDGMALSEIDSTAVYLNPSMRIFYANGPATIEKIRNQIDNNKKDLDLKKITCDVTIIGRPQIRSGMVFNISGVSSRLNGRYYCISVKHIIDTSSGYICKLSLGKIIKPSPISRSVVTVSNDLEEDGYTKKMKRLYRVLFPYEVSVPINPWGFNSPDDNDFEWEFETEERDPIEDLINPNFTMPNLRDTEVDFSERFSPEGVQSKPSKTIETTTNIKRESEEDE